MKQLIVYCVAILLCFMTACTSIVKDEATSTNLYRILVADKYGFIDEYGKIIIEPQFDNTNLQFSEGVCFARIGERCGLIDCSGCFIEEFNDSTEYVSSFVKGFSKIEMMEKKRSWRSVGLGSGTLWYNPTGIINKKGEFVIPTSYMDAIVNVDENSVYFLVYDIISDSNWAWHWSILDSTGNVIGKEFDSILSGFHNGLCAVKQNGKWGYIDTSGKFAIDTIYDFARDFTECGIARVKRGNEHLFIDKSGNRLFPVDSIITGFTCNRAAVVMNGEKCFVDPRGEIVFKIDADVVHGFNKEDYLATIIKHGKATKIDTMGNVVLSTNYDDIGRFIGGVAPIKKNKKWGFIDITGKEIVSVENDKYVYALHDIESKIRAVWNNYNDIWCLSYYDLQGQLIWKDTPVFKKELSAYSKRQDYVDYYDEKLSELDPIEGIYYVTFDEIVVDRENDHASSNGSSSGFYAIVQKPNTNEFVAYAIDDEPGFWVKKFVRIGESNTYAVVDKGNNSNWAEDGKLILEDPYMFEIALRQGGNNYFNWYVQCEFIKDYPSAEVYEQVQQAEWYGTGFAIDNSYVVTNYHVVKGAKSIRIRGINGDQKEAYKGYVVASDKEHDLAIIKIIDNKFNGFDNIPYCIGKSMPEVGDNIFVLGYPMTNTMGKEIKLTDGIISAASGFKGDQSMYQISAAVQPGNSGGPLLDENGNVVGVIRAKHVDAENANYAIKISYLYNLINSSELEIKMSNSNKLKAKSLSQKVKK